MCTAIFPRDQLYQSCAIAYSTIVMVTTMDLVNHCRWLNYVCSRELAYLKVCTGRRWSISFPPIFVLSVDYGVCLQKLRLRCFYVRQDIRTRSRAVHYKFLQSIDSEPIAAKSRLMLNFLLKRYSLSFSGVTSVCNSIVTVVCFVIRLS